MCNMVIIYGITRKPRKIDSQGNRSYLLDPQEQEKACSSEAQTQEIQSNPAKGS